MTQYLQPVAHDSTIGHLGIKKTIDGLIPIPPSFRIFMQYDGLLNVPIAKELKKIFMRDERVRLLEGQMISRGSGNTRFDVDRLVMWSMWSINEFGLSHTGKNLDLFLNSPTLTIEIVFWVLGVEIDESIDFLNGVSLLPISKMPYSEAKERFLYSRLNQQVNFLTPQSAFICKCEVNKVVDSSIYESVSEDSFLEVSKKISQVVLLLNVLKDTSCVIYYQTSSGLDHAPLGFFGSTGGGSSLPDSLGIGSSKVTQEHATKVESIFEKFSSLDDDLRLKYSLAINRLSQAKRKSAREDKILDLGIALEMLLLDGGTEQLSLMFRLRGSWLIGESASDRLIVFNKLKGLYSYRSQVAHNGQLKIKAGVDFDSEFSDFMEIAERVIFKLIEYGKKVDWDKIILGES